ncbi:hypothetical protein MNBD_GAMMA11-749 [hydrothermal vent metagenome]|uniref:Lipoprotein n=1 Tax=hydrothermal vent metagenome TaxID=652676 RepID=A0A3B0WPK0_9ZZZZ
MKYLALALALILTLTLTACGGDGPKDLCSIYIVLMIIGAIGYPIIMSALSEMRRSKFQKLQTRLSESGLSPLEQNRASVKHFEQWANIKAVIILLISVLLLVSLLVW